MSLDVYLTRPREEKPQALLAAELLRTNGFDEFATEIECRHDCSEREYLCDLNVTHNLNRMAEAAGIYKHLWRPDEIEITKASQLIAPLQAGLQKLVADSDYYKRFNPENGWGSYDGFVRFVQAYLAACQENPTADVHVSR
jgi:hypothetical protein